MRSRILAGTMVALVMLVAPGVALAGVYGDGLYGAGPYSGTDTSVIQIGPVSLPNTGATWLILIGAVMGAVGMGLFLWLRRRGKHQPIS